MRYQVRGFEGLADAQPDRRARTVAQDGRCATIAPHGEGEACTGRRIKPGQDALFAFVRCRWPDRRHESQAAQASKWLSPVNAPIGAKTDGLNAGGIAARKGGIDRLFEHAGSGGIGVGANHPYKACLERLRSLAADLELDGLTGSDRKAMAIAD